MKNLILGIILGLIFVGAGAFVYFRFGFAPVATAAQPMPFEKTLANYALNARVAKEAPKTVPIGADAANLMAGAHVYVENCAMCHGLPENRTAMFRDGMFPHPPQLFHGKGVTDDPAGETYWKVTNGIRMTGMASFGRMLDDTQSWQVSLLLAKADKLPLDVRTYLQTKPMEK